MKKNQPFYLLYRRGLLRSKFFKVSKITLLLLLTFTLTTIKGYSQNTKISLSYNNVPLKTVLTQIEKQSEFFFVYNTNLIDANRKVSITVKNQSVKNILDKLFNGSNVRYEVLDKQIVLSIRDGKNENQPSGTSKPDMQTSGENNTVDTQSNENIVLQSKPFNITGRVINAKGEVLVGVTVAIKGTNRGTITDMRGYYSLQLRANDKVLVFSYVGMKRQEVEINGLTSINIVLKDDIALLKEVEVISTGYQTLTKERATGSFAKPNMEVFKNRTGTMDIISRLDGMIPGLWVMNIPEGVTSNMNGNGVTHQRSMLRGRSSIWTDSDPLYVVDGVSVSDFSTINPEDIADITVLKDASAAAIWGARATNGVIVVTTKKGNKDSKIKVNYTGFVNFQGKPDLDYSPMLNSKQYIQAAKEIFDPTNYPWESLSTSFIAPHEEILYNQYRGLISAKQANASLDSLAAINNKGQIKNLLNRNAFTTGHTIAISGGGTVYSFYSSFSYTNTQNNRPGDKNDAYRISLNQDFNLNKNLKISLNTSLNNTIASSKRPISIDNAFLPYQLFKDENGNSINMPYMAGWSEATRLDYQARSRINLDYYPLDEMNYGYTKSDNLSFNLTGNVDLKLLKGLSFRGTYGYVKTPGTIKSYDDIKSLSLREELLSMTVAPSVSSTPIYYLPTTGGDYKTSNNEQRNWTSRNQLVYKASPRNGKDQLDIQVGQEANEQFSMSNSTLLKGYNEALQTYATLDYATLSNGIFGVVPSFMGFYSTPPYAMSETLLRFTSYFALASYNFNHKYSIDGSWRVDHSNLFGSDKSTQNKPVWSVGGKWFLSREDFMKDIIWMDDLAIRATYGITGNSPSTGGTAATVDILSAPSIYSGLPLAGTYLSVSSPANNKLAWEATKTINIGVDFTLFKRRIGGSIDLYRKNTTSLLGTTPVNYFTGWYPSVSGNIGNMINKGIELSLHTLTLQIKNFSWTTNLVFSYNKNKLVSYAASDYLNTASGRMSSTYIVGYSMAPLFAYRFAGLDNMGDPMIKLSDGTITKDPNAATSKDLVYKGTTQPVFTGGLTNTFGYKGFSLTANMVYNLGNVMRRDVNTFYTGRLTGGQYSFNIGNINAYFTDRWKNPGDEAFTNIPSYVSNNYINYTRRNTNYYTYGDINVVSASYIKLRDITLSYSLPGKVLQALKVQMINLSVQLSNFMVWKANNAGIDPEYQNYASGKRGIPPSKHPVNFGLNITF